MRLRDYIANKQATRKLVDALELRQCGVCGLLLLSDPYCPPLVLRHPRCGGRWRVLERLERGAGLRLLYGRHLS